MTRRGMLRGVAGLAALTGMGAAAGVMLSASPGLADEITVHKTPTCGCCGAWVTHLEENGFTVKVEEHSQGALNRIKQKLGVPEAMESCHTGIIDGYLVEGHVPASDIKRLIAERPAVDGLSVPGMPIGSPGMEMGDQKDRYDVIAFGKGEPSVFASY